MTAVKVFGQFLNEKIVLHHHLAGVNVRWLPHTDIYSFCRISALLGCARFVSMCVATIRNPVWSCLFLNFFSSSLNVINHLHLVHSFSFLLLSCAVETVVNICFPLYVTYPIISFSSSSVLHALVEVPILLSDISTYFHFRSLSPVPSLLPVGYISRSCNNMLQTALNVSLPYFQIRTAAK